jgi:HEPN domain-containing protein
MAQGKTAQVRRAKAPLYLEKATQFLDEARSGLEANRNDAALLNAIHAAINASDAVTVALAGIRSSDPDHQRAADLLEQVVSGDAQGHERARQLRSLLSRKNAVEYEARKASAKDARYGVERADRLVGWAKEIVAKARL